ncbi:hypothetical protein B0H17DRAFT_1257151 [Mycena rosella]|uniref:Uncharacterized protein n=1 Tax=Mycena rosella TaxID=1033263 RepID=A0AAD7CUW1_MYCRO|nr:hypothetical protein B0H17DRAFT_1257151 [Mycena rosella]
MGLRDTDSRRRKLKSGAITGIAVERGSPSCPSSPRSPSPHHAVPLRHGRAGEKKGVMSRGRHALGVICHRVRRPQRPSPARINQTCGAELSWPAQVGAGAYFVLGVRNPIRSDWLAHRDGTSRDQGATSLGLGWDEVGWILRRGQRRVEDACEGGVNAPIVSHLYVPHARLRELKARGVDSVTGIITKFVEAIKGPCDLGKFRQGFDASRKPLTRLSQARQQPAKPSLAFWRVFKPLSLLIQALAHLPRDRLSEPPRRRNTHAKCYACGTFCQPGRGLTNHYGKCSTLKAQHAEGAAYANSVDAEAEAAAAAAAAVSVLPDPPADMDFETIDARPPTPPPLRPRGRPPRRIRLPKRYRDDPPDAPAPVPPPPPANEEAEVPAEPAPGTAPATWVKTEPNKYGL